MTQDTGKFRTNTNDQFYTKEAVAKTCIQHILITLPEAPAYLWVEPSAGTGAFLKNKPPVTEAIGLDLDPKGTNILKQDYLEWTPPTTNTKPILVFGNPPFGRQSKTAKEFIKKSCTFATAIAFILPKSFTKPSMFNAFDKNFHLIQTIDLEPNAFLINGANHNVPCVFQIWQKQTTLRPVEQKINPIGFQYVKATESYDAAFRRVGANAGRCYINDTTLFSAQSHYFLKFDPATTPHLDQIIEKINKHTFPSNTVGSRSLSKTEVNSVLNSIVQGLATT